MCEKKLINMCAPFLAYNFTYKKFLGIKTACVKHNVLNGNQCYRAADDSRRAFPAAFEQLLEATR